MKRWLYPKVTVVISTYERPALLHRAMLSVLAQTYDDFELIVVDDGSDKGRAVCTELAPAFEERDIPLTYVNLPENSGYQARPKNHGIFLAQGSYVAYLDDDNEWDRDHLEVLVREIEKGETDFVYSRWRYRGDGPGTGQEFPFVQATPPACAGLIQAPTLNFIDSSSILHSKAAVLERFGQAVWNEELNRFGDWEFVARAMLNGMRFRGVDRVTYTYWWHGENLQLTREPSPIDTGRGNKIDVDVWLVGKADAA